MLRLCPALLPPEVGKSLSLCPALPPPEDGKGQSPAQPALGKRYRGLVRRAPPNPPAGGSSWDSDGGAILGLERNFGPRNERKCSSLDGRPIAAGQFRRAANCFKWPRRPTRPERPSASRTCCGHNMVAATHQDEVIAERSVKEVIFDLLHDQNKQWGSPLVYFQLKGSLAWGCLQAPVARDPQHQKIFDHYWFGFNDRTHLLRMEQLHNERFPRSRKRGAA
jgi:hypothetical protein